MTRDAVAGTPLLALPVPWSAVRCRVLRQGEQRRPQLCQSSCLSFSTRGRFLAGLLESEMAYFSTVFKMEVTVTAQVSKAAKDQCFFIWCSVPNQTCSEPT